MVLIITLTFCIIIVIHLKYTIGICILILWLRLIGDFILRVPGRREYVLQALKMLSGLNV